MDSQRVKICDLAEQQCIPMDFLEVKNKSTYWCGFLLILILFGILITWYIATSDDLFWLKIILTIAFIIVGFWMIKTMFATDSIFKRLVPINF